MRIVVESVFALSVRDSADIIAELEGHIYRYDIWMFEILIYRQQSMHVLLYTAWLGQIDTNAYCRKILFRAFRRSVCVLVNKIR